MPNQQNSAACSLRYLSQPHEDGAHFVCPVHVHIGTEIRLDRVDDDQSGVVLNNGFFNSFIGERQLHIAVINDQHPVKVCPGFDQAGLDRIAQTVLCGLVDHVEGLHALHVGQQAILLIGHLNKAAGMQSLQRGLGSIDIAAAVRSVMFIGKLKHDPTMRILTHEKSSLAPPGVSLAFSLGDEGGFRWVGEYDITADEMLSGIEPQRETKTQQAKDLICALLAGGKQVLSEDIDKAALERGIPGRTVRDAKRELGDALKSKIVEGRKKVFWME